MNFRQENALPAPANTYVWCRELYTTVIRLGVSTLTYRLRSRRLKLDGGDLTATNYGGWERTRGNCPCERNDISV